MFDLFGSFSANCPPTVVVQHLGAGLAGTLIDKMAAEIAPKIEALFEKYGLSYCARPLPQQVYSAWHKVVRLSLPNGWLASTNKKNLPTQLGKLYKMATGTPRERRLIQASITRDANRLQAA